MGSETEGRVPVPIPVCYRFRPTDKELIEFFLMRKASKQALPEVPHILEKQLYGEQAPWDVFQEDDPWEYLEDSQKRIVFVFSKVISKNGQNKNRIVRTAGCGTWDGKAVSKKIKNSEGKVIAHKRAFTFKPKKGYESEMKGKWIMHEYSLSDSDENFKDGDCVICRISYHVPKERLPHEEEEEYVSVSDSNLSHKGKRKLCKSKEDVKNKNKKKKNRSKKTEKSTNCEIGDRKLCDDDLENQTLMGKSRSRVIIPYSIAVRANQSEQVIPYSNQKSVLSDNLDDLKAKGRFLRM